MPIKEKITNKRYIYERRVLKYGANFSVWSWIQIYFSIVELCTKVNPGFTLVSVDKKQRFVWKTPVEKVVYSCKKYTIVYSSIYFHGLVYEKKPVINDPGNVFPWVYVFNENIITILFNKQPVVIYKWDPSINPHALLSLVALFRYRSMKRNPAGFSCLFLADWLLLSIPAGSCVSSAIFMHSSRW